MSSSAGGDRRGINITDGSRNVPGGLLRMPCSRFYIEFLKVSSEGLSVDDAAHVKNHATFKIDFHGDFEDTFGVRIDMGPDLDSQSIRSENRDNSFALGDLFLNRRSYLGRSDSTCRTIELPLRQGVSLVQLLDAFMDYRVHYFSFICIRSKYYGCRDFITQALYMMQYAGLVSSDITSTVPMEQELRVRDAYSALGMRFRIYPPGQGRACPIDKGKFEYHQRVEDPRMPYVGSQAAAQLESYLGQ